MTELTPTTEAHIQWLAASQAPRRWATLRVWTIWLLLGILPILNLQPTPWFRSNKMLLMAALLALALLIHLAFSRLESRARAHAAALQQQFSTLSSGSSHAPR